MKKQNIKHERKDSGITLIALIITIIVLLILAVVAIGAVNNTGIIQYAQNSVEEYGNAQDKENTTLQNYMDILEHHNQNGETSNPPEGEEKPPAGNLITLLPKTLSVEAGKSSTITATLTGITDQVEWTSSVPEYIEVVASEDGVTATVTVDEETQIGTKATITAKCGNYEETCEVTVINFWQANGMTSENVNFDTLYWSNDFDYNPGAWHTFTLGIYNNGDLCLDHNGEEEDTGTIVPSGGTGSNGATKEQLIQAGYVGQTLKVFENGFSVPYGYWYLTFRYTTDNKVKMYLAESEPEGGHIPEEDSYLFATLLPQN